MNDRRFLRVLFNLGWLALGCSGGTLAEQAGAPKPPLSIARPHLQPALAAQSSKTEQLRATLALLAKSEHLAFGHEDTTAYGVGWKGDPDRSDVKSLCGSHAAVYGWDLGDIGAAENLDGVGFAAMRTLIQDAYRRSGINTVSMHLDNPSTGGNAWDTRPTVAELLPGGEHHARYRATLDLVAAFFRECRADDGELIPLIFRPFHEHNGGWFWWGDGRCTKEEFVALFRYTVDYLRLEQALDNLLVAYSPGAGHVEDEADYFLRYPGDEYVDVFGFDVYYRNDPRDLVRVAELTVQLAEQRGKLAAITEFGVDAGLSNPAVDTDRWFTRDFLQPLLASPQARRLTYALAWRNANPDHFFVPYPGHPAAADFQRFCADPFVVLNDALPR